MITYETENYTVLCPKFRILLKNEIKEIREFFNNPRKNKYPAIDMENICSLSPDFFDLLKEFKNRTIILLNTPPELIAVLNLTGFDKRVKLFINTIDMEEDRRELRNRKFTVV